MSSRALALLFLLAAAVHLGVSAGSPANPAVVSFPAAQPSPLSAPTGSATPAPSNTPPGIKTPALTSTIVTPTLQVGANVSETIRAAVGRTFSLRSYRTMLSITAKPATETIRPTVLTRLELAVRGADFHLVTATAGLGQEQIQLGDKVYQRQGPDLEAKAWTESKVFPGSEGVAFIQFLLAAQYQNALGDLAQYQPAGSETLNGETCQVYAAEKYAAAAAITKLIVGSYLFEQQGQALTNEYFDGLYENAAAIVWLCADGAWRVQLVAETKPQDSTMLSSVLPLDYSTAQRLEAWIRVDEPDGDIQITAPTNVITPEPPTPTPTSLPTSTPSAAQATAAAATRQTAQALLSESLKWETVFTDSFATNDRNWTTEAGRTVVDSKYVWDLSARVNIFRGLPEMEELSDFAATIEVEQVGGSPDCGYGITFRNSRPQDTMFDYVFYIHDDGRWGFDIIHSPDPGIAMSDDSNAIQSGDVNRLTVIAQGEQYTFYVNDEFVARTEDGTLDRGKVGAAVWVLGGEDGCRVEFDNFKLRAAPASAVTPIPKVDPGTAGEVILTGFDPANAAEFPTGAYNGALISGTREIVSSTYRWQAAASDDAIDQFAIPKMESVTDLTASVTVFPIQRAERAAGLVFRHSDPDNQYVFRLTGFDTYNFGVMADRHYRALIFPTQSDTIKSGEPNRLTVVAAGPNIQLYINGQLVNQVEDSTLASGTVGVMAEVYDAGTEALFEYSDFELRVPFPTPAETVTAEPTFRHTPTSTPTLVATRTGSPSASLTASPTETAANPPLPTGRNTPSATPSSTTVSAVTQREPTGTWDTQAARVQAALDKKRQLQSHRGAISFHIEQAQFLDWRGDVRGPDAHFTFFVNNKYVGEIEDNALTQGQIGVVYKVDTVEPAMFEFDNFEVRAP